MAISTQIRAQHSPAPGDMTGSSATGIDASGEAPAPASGALTGVSVRGGRFNNSANANNNFSLSLFNLILGPGDYASPNGTQSEFPSVVYSRLLLPKACGFPLYDPQPPPWLNDQYTQEGVSIGDVGIVTTGGSFDFLFNIRYAAEHPINMGGVPPCFSPPEWASYTVPLLKNGRDPGSYIANGSIQVLGESNPASGDYRFIGNAGEGAVLVTPTSTVTAQIPNTGQFRDYAAENAFAWYKFAEQLGRDAPNGSMYLVTGWEKTHTWGTASFEGNIHDFELTYRNGTWTRYGLATTHRGPTGANAENPELFNQCIFLSGYKMTLGETLWQRVLGTVQVSGVGNTAQKTSVLRGSSIFTRAPPVGSLARWTYSTKGALSGSEQSRQGVDQSESGDTVLESIDPSTIMDVHPSNLINRFLLSKVPNARVAITHDSVWCSIINDVHAPFDDQLNALYTITTQNGVVSLTERSVKMCDQPSSSAFQQKIRNDPKTSSEAGNSLHELPSPTSKATRKLLPETKDPLLPSDFRKTISDPEDEDDAYGPPSQPFRRLSSKVSPSFTTMEDPSPLPLLRWISSNVIGGGRWIGSNVIGPGRRWIGSTVLGLTEAALNPVGSDQIQKAEPSSPDTVPAKLRFAGLSPLHLRRELFNAVKRNNVDDVRELLRRGVDVNSLDVNQNTPLRVAAEAGFADIVDVLLAQPGITVNDQNKCGQSALIHATTWGYSDVIQSLLGHHGIDVNARDSEGLTALGIAAFYGHADVVRLLLDDPRVEINAEAKNGHTPLGVAVAAAENEEVVELLKGKKAICKP